MTENQIEFFELLQELQHKIICLSNNNRHAIYEGKFPTFPGNYFEKLEAEVKQEVLKISELFYTSKRAALVLGAIIYLYLKHEGVKTNFITFGDIERFFNIDYELLFSRKIRESIFELEEKNIIEIKDAEFYLVRVFNKSDRRENDYYLIPAKPSFVPFANKKFELTISTINKLNYL